MSAQPNPSNSKDAFHSVSGDSASLRTTEAPANPRAPRPSSSGDRLRSSGSRVEATHFGSAPTSSEPGRLGQAGQATAEYALVLLGAAAIALLLVAWATASGKIDQLFDFVIDQLISKAG